MNRLEKIQEMLKSSPDDPFLNYALGMEHSSAGDSPAALAALRGVVQLDANYVAAYFQQGQILAREGENEAARQVLQEGITVARRVGDAHAAGEMTEFLDAL